LIDAIVQQQEEDGWQIQIDTNFPTQNFTLAVAAHLQHVQVNGQPLQEVSTISAVTTGTYLVQPKETVLAFDLPQGRTTVTVI